MNHRRFPRTSEKTPSSTARWTCLLVLGGAVFGFIFPAAASQVEPDRFAFDWALVEDANPLPNGMMLVMYGDRDHAAITHVSLHRVFRVLPGIEPDLPVEEASRLTALIIDGTLGPLTYLISREPLYYGTDLDESGLPRRLWQDSEEDGMNGNEQPMARVELTLDELAHHRP